MKTPLRILVIDDNPDDRILARRKLEQNLANFRFKKLLMLLN
jgi:CheY-like chemotaxis protein